MERSSVVSRNDRKSLIESEPMTLTFDQIRYAREVALYVLNTRSIEEAMNIFMEGLQPVKNVTKQDGERMMELQEELEYLEDELQEPLKRDVATTPF